MFYENLSEFLKRNQIDQIYYLDKAGPTLPLEIKPISVDKIKLPQKGFFNK